VVVVVQVERRQPVVLLLVAAGLEGRLLMETPVQQTLAVAEVVAVAVAEAAVIFAA
jgi:hypothetical protein